MRIVKATLILEAGDIPEHSTVRKPTGAKKYELRHRLPLYGEGVAITHIADNICFMTSDSGINIIPQDTKLALDFDDARDAKDFLNRLIESNYVPQ